MPYRYTNDAGERETEEGVGRPSSTAGTQGGSHPKERAEPQAARKPRERKRENAPNMKKKDRNTTPEPTGT